MKTRVGVVFPANPPDQPSWPHIGYGVEKRSEEVLALLKAQLPEFEFSAGVYYSAEEAEQDGERIAQGMLGRATQYLIVDMAPHSSASHQSDGVFGAHFNAFAAAGAPNRLDLRHVTE